MASYCDRFLGVGRGGTMNCAGQPRSDKAALEKWDMRIRSERALRLGLRPQSLSTKSTRTGASLCFVMEMEGIVYWCIRELSQSPRTGGSGSYTPFFLSAAGGFM